MRRRLLVWLLVLGVWTIVAAAFAVGSSLTYMIAYQPPQWGRTLAAALTEWYAWAALTPLVVWLARRLALSRRRWGRRALLLALAGVPIGMIKIVLSQIFRATAGVPGYALPGNLMAQYLIYWGIIGVVHAAAYYGAEAQRELRASQLEARLAETRLQLLKMQLHPHFLFNTLNAVSELVHEDPAAAERMIASLGELLRESLDAGTVDQVTLARELDLLGRYLEIQRARFGDRLDVRLEIEDAARQVLVPHLILQPLVENAIRHGVSRRVASGRIDIRARRAGGRLLLEIQDDGPGVSTEQPAEGVGLGNTRARLTELYGSHGAIEIRNADEGGALVRLTLPWRTDPHGTTPELA